MHDWEHRSDAFERQAIPHTASLLRTALRLTRSRSEAEDLVQDTLLAAWRAFDRFELGTDCKAWLFRIMLNRSNHFRNVWKQSLRMVSIEDSGDSAFVAHKDFDPVQAREVKELLSELPEEQRIVLILAAVEGFSCKEIAQIISSPIGTVMSRLSRARAALRERLIATEESDRSQKRANGL